jgi:glycogen debranching enzyme
MPDLDAVLSDEGWPYASAPPVEPGDPGRFHALFGRDSLIVSLQLLPARPDVARATLRALAARQGRSTDPGTQEEPGKIGHEFRAAPPAGFAGWPPGEFRYYATADATSWFCVVAAAVRDPGLEDAWRAAAGWLERAMDAGGGLVRHSPGTLPGLTQQGWRDTIDPAKVNGHGGGILRADGTAPAPPLADADTQAVTVAALRALHALSGEAVWRERAEAMRAVLSRRFGPEVMALEAGDRPVPGAGSQLGWLLWADALEPDAAEAAAERLCRPDILTPWGLRTLAAGAPNFAPGGLPPRRGVAVRLLARLGRPARRRPHRGGRAGAHRRPRRARPARPRARALRGHRRWRARARADLQPAAGLDGRRALGAGERVGRARHSRCQSWMTA